MAQREITVLKDVALITCVVQRGAAEPIINILEYKQEHKEQL